MNHQSYAKQNMKVFPCFHTKAPATGSGFYDATTDLSILDDKFRQKDAHLIGLPCGAMNNIAVLDFDLYKIEIDIDHLKETITEYEKEKGNDVHFPETLTVQTQSGGIHYYYKIDPAKGKIQNATKIFGKAIPVDIRGDGGYIIAPDYKRYIPLDVEQEGLEEDFYSFLAEAPEWIYKIPKKEDNEFLNNPVDPLDDEEYRELETALSMISSDDRDRWVNFGMALKNTGSDRAFYLWDEWSKKSDLYNPDDQQKRWEGFKPNGEITIASIFDLAKKKGWTTTYQSVREINLDEIDERKNHEKQPFPDELLHVPGLVGEIIDHINKFSKKPQPILALAASLSACGAIMGQRFQTDQGLRTNLYVLGVGESGSGKEAARSSIKRLFEAANIGEWSATEDLASDAAILSTLEKAPSQVFLLDEIGRFLKTTNQASSKNAHLYNIISVLLKIYSSANQTYRGKAYADLDKQKVVEHPNLCIYGTTVPRTLFEGLTVENITDGFLSRFMIFESENPNPEPSGRIKMAHQSINESLVKKVKEIISISRCPGVEGNLAQQTKVDPQVVEMTEDAECLLNDYERYIYEKREQLRKEDRIDTTYNRAVQFAEQIALIVSVGREYKRPLIEFQDVEYAVKLVSYLSDRVFHIAEHFIAKNEYEHEGKRIMSIIRTAGKRGITASQLTRKTQHLKQYERNDILESLEGSDQILIALEGRTKRYFPKKIQYGV